MTAEPFPYPVICGHRETRTDGTYGCVRPPLHPDHGHTWIRLTRTEPEPA